MQLMLLFISAQVFHCGRKRWEPLLPREKCYPLKGGRDGMAVPPPVWWIRGGREVEAAVLTAPVPRQGGGDKEGLRIWLHNGRKKKIIKSCLNLEWSKFNPQVFVFLLPELLKRNVNQHGENCAKHLSLMWAVCIYNPICQISGKKWILLEQLKNRQEWNRILFSKDSFRPRNCSSYQVYVTLDSVLDGIFHNATYQQK